MAGRTRRRWRMVILAALVLVSAVGLFDLAMAWLVHRETTLPPEEGAGWMLSAQVFEPAAGVPRRGSAVMLHGFVGSPYDLSPLVVPLTERGFRVVVPVLPGQSRAEAAWDRDDVTPDAFLAWTRTLIADETRTAGRTPVLVGFSMGGALAIIAAADGGVDRLVLLAPYLGLTEGDETATRVAELAQWVAPFMPKTQRGKINDPDGYARYEPGSYVVSLPGFLQLQALAARARAAAPGLELPTLVVYAPGDSVASGETARRLFDDRANVELLAATRSDHVLLFDYDADAVIARVVAFLEKPAQAAISP